MVAKMTRLRCVLHWVNIRLEESEIIEIRSTKIVRDLVNQQFGNVVSVSLQQTVDDMSRRLV